MMAIYSTALTSALDSDHNDTIGEPFRRRQSFWQQASHGLLSPTRFQAHAELGGLLVVTSGRRASA